MLTPDRSFDSLNRPWWRLDLTLFTILDVLARRALLQPTANPVDHQAELSPAEVANEAAKIGTQPR